MKLARFAVLGAAAGIFLLCSKEARAGEPTRGHAQITKRVAQAPRLTSSQKKLQETRQKLIRRKKDSRADLANLVMAYEKKLESQTADYLRIKESYEKNLISNRELQESEGAVNSTRSEIERVREWIAEDDIALSLTEEAAEEEIGRLPAVAFGGYDETATLIRYNGGVNWSLAQVGKIKAYFLERFGYPLPVSALGQSVTHDRLGLDHRDAVDVAVRPDSPQGRALMTYLRKHGIPFLAFRNAVRGVATGAHIHIGRRSLRLVQSKQAPENLVAPQREADQS